MSVHVIRATSTPAKPTRIGTRGSPLALAQAHEVRGRLAAAHGLAPEFFTIAVLKTTGDRILDRPLAEVGGKGLFTKEIEEALIADEVDIAVHSMKDMATAAPEGLIVGAVLPREDVRDAFLSLKYRHMSEMPAGAIVGTSSLRRQAQVLWARPDLKVVAFRGNVQTRLQKLAEGVADATYLACAGLNRLGLAHRIAAIMETADMLPAVAQGAIAVQIREKDAEMAQAIAPLNDSATAACVHAERVFLARLEGSCRTPIAGYGKIVDGTFVFHGMILAPDGREMHETRRQGPVADALALADDAACELLAKAGPTFFQVVV